MQPDRSELMFLLHKNPDTPRWADPELAPVGRFEERFKENNLMVEASEKDEIQKKRVPGRPKKAVNKSSFLMVRLTPSERVLIEGRAKKAGIKPSEWFRRSAKSARVFPRFTVEETGWFRVLAGLANNLNQLTHLAHVAGLFSLALKCQALLKQVDDLLKKISHDR